MLLAALGFLLVLVAPGWSVEVGEPMPDFSIRTMDGKEFSRATLVGKPLLLVFWNTWCPNCMRELPGIDRLAEKLGPRGLTVLAVNTGINDTERKSRAYWEKSRYRFPTGFDHDFEVGQAFRVRGVPTVYLVDAKGVVRYKGAVIPGDMEKRFRQLVAD